MSKTLLAAAIGMWLSAGSAVAAEGVQGEWTGYITDTHCGINGANAEHTAACVAKCMKGGSKAQIRNEANGEIYDLAAFDAKVRPLVGKRVTLTGSIDTDTHVITVREAKVAAEKK